MKPAFYFNVSVTAKAFQGGPAGVSILALSKAVHVVHGVAANGKFEFASAFPNARTDIVKHHPGTVLRIFTQTREQCEVIADGIEASEALAGYLQVGRIRAVPPELPQSVEYRLFRMGSRKAYNATQGKIGKSGIAWKEPTRVPAGERWSNRLKAAESLPYLRMRSSTGNEFSIRFTPEVVDGLCSEECSPNGYGFSTATKPFRLPLIVDDVTPGRKIRSTEIG